MFLPGQGKFAPKPKMWFPASSLDFAYFSIRYAVMRGPVFVAPSWHVLSVSLSYVTDVNVSSALCAGAVQVWTEVTASACLGPRVGGQ